MTDVNHRRKNRKPVNQRYAENTYRNGYAHPDNKEGVKGFERWLEAVKAEHAELGLTNVCYPNPVSGSQRVGRTDYLDKSMHGWGHTSLLADRNVGGHIGNDFTNGHRGMAKAVRGAKKRARTALRFHENAATKKLALTAED